MRGTRFTQEPIVHVLHEHDAGGAPPARCRQHGLSAQPLDRWKQQSGGLERGAATRLQVLEAENTRRKRLVAEQALDNQILQALLRRGRFLWDHFAARWTTLRADNVWSVNKCS